jgi:hypothetical protein
MSPNAGGGGCCGCGVSANEYCCAHGAQINFEDLTPYLKRDMAMRRIFWGFCRNWFLIDPVHFLSSRSDFGFKFAEIFIIEK